MTGPKRVRNIADLAEIAGVTPGTVSRALSGKGLLSATTRARIKALAEEHQFRPSALARNLRTQRTGAINVVIPLGHDRSQPLSDPFFMTMIGHLADGLTEKGYELILSRVLPESPDWLERYADNGRADGIIVIGQSTESGALDRVARSYLPLVAWGGAYPGQVHCSVGSDNFLGGALAAEHLVSKGCRSIAFFGDPAAIEIRQRLDGCKAALKKAGLKAQPFILPAHLAEDRGGEDITDFLDAEGAMPDGVFAATDIIAMNTLRALAEHETAVPEKVRVIGFDDLPIAKQTVPRLTTIRQDFSGGARLLIDTLFRRMAGERTPSIVMQPTLVVRRSA